MLFVWRDEPIRLRPQLAWLWRGTLLGGAVLATAWLGNHQAAVLAALVGAASLAIFGWDSSQGTGGGTPFEAPQELRAAFHALCAELKLTGTLYAYYDDEQQLRPAVTTEPEVTNPLRLGSDPISRALQTTKPQVFNAYAGPAALAKSSFQGRSTLVFPALRLGRPVGVAVLTSHQAEIDEALIDRVRSAEPLLALLLENEVLAGRLARSRSEKEALLALTRLAQGRPDPEQVFREAALHLRQLTGASHAAIALRAPGDRLTLVGLSAEGGAKVRETFLAIDWAEREWPHLHAAFGDPLGSVLVSFSAARLTPTEAAWAQQVAPNGHLLCVAFGPREEREGLVMLCWPEESALRIHESRLAERIGELMALIAASRRLAHARAAAVAGHAEAAQRATMQEALLAKFTLEARNATFAVRHFKEALQAGAIAPEQALSALDQQVERLATWPGLGDQTTETSVSECLQAAEVIARETCRRKAQVLVVEALPEAEVALARSALLQVLGALLDNASRYSSTGTTVRMWTAVSEAWVTIYVADEGRGIPEDAAAHIGEPGFQADRARGGQGMALAHAREILDRAEGMLGFTSQPGRGTTFYVTLPRRAGGV